MTKRYLVLPDTHVEPGGSMVRAKWLGRYIKDIQPDVIVHIGDLAEMGSMSYHDDIKTTDYVKDCKAVNRFQEILTDEAGEAWTKARTVFLVGNHEHRITRRTEECPELFGAISIGDLGVYDYFDTVVEWEGGPGIYEGDGVLFAHFIQSRMGRAIGGVNHARTLLLRTMQSVVVGHSHQLNYSCTTNAKGEHLHALVCGCFFSDRQKWAGQSNESYWRGVAVLNGVSKGNFDLQLMSLKMLRRDYG